jgi:hypothetical protein
MKFEERAGIAKLPLTQFSSFYAYLFQAFSSAILSTKPYFYVLTLRRETRFKILIKQQVILQLSIFYSITY